MDILNVDNLIYPAGYFEPEVREGFYVSGMMKRFWAAQIRVLSEIAKVCEKHGICWFADCGTLLGAVRHGGYIPWDDDLDICMLREDWLIFAEVAQAELPEGYFVRTTKTDLEYDDLIMRVINSQNMEFSEEHLRKYYNCPYSVGVDIFPLDGVYEEEEREDDRRARIQMLEDAVNLLAEGQFNTSKCKRLLSEIERKNHVTLRRGADIVIELLSLSNQIYMECPTKDAQYVALMNYWIPKKNHKYSKELFEHTVYMPFENVWLPVPARYDEVLRIEYGDYMYVKKDGGIHEYPCYTKQEAVFRSQMGTNLYRYTFDRNKFTKIRKEQRISLWDQCLKVFETISKVHESLEKLVANGQGELAGKLLEHCQTLAISLGTELEKKVGEDAEIIHLLELYCEELYQSAGDWRGIAPLEERIQQIRKKFDVIQAGAKEVVFLPCHKDSWNVMGRMWQQMCNKQNTICRVIPIPYYERDIDGNLDLGQEERLAFPESIPITDINTYDFEKHHPDAIVVDQPYDGWNLAGGVTDFFFSENLRKYTDKLIYLSCIELDDPVAEGDKADRAVAELAEQPAIIYADEVILGSEGLQKCYINHLTGFAGDDSRAYWEQKIVIAERTESIPDGRKTNFHKARQKPVLLFHTTISFILEYKQKAIGSIKRALKTMTDTEDIVCIWYIDEAVSCLKDIEPELWRLLEDVRRSFQNRIQIYEKEEMTAELLEECNAFYGNPGRLAHICRNQRKPVMIQSADCVDDM